MSWPRKTRLIVLVIIIFLLIVVLTRMDFGKTWEAFTKISWRWATCVLLLNVLNTWVEAARWRLLLSPVKKIIPVHKAFAAILVGVVGNTLFPFRFGDGARAYFLAREEQISVASSLSTVVVDRVADIALFLVLVAFTTFLFPFPASVKASSLLAGSLFGLGLIVLIVLVQLSQRFAPKLTGKMGQRVAVPISRFTSGLAGLRGIGLHLQIILLSTLSWSVRLVMVYAMFSAFHLDLPLIATAVVLVFINLGIAVVSTPANLGGFELAAVAACKLFAIDTELAVSFAIVLHVVEVIPMLLLGLIVLWFGGYKSSQVLANASNLSVPLNLN